MVLLCWISLKRHCLACFIMIPSFYMRRMSNFITVVFVEPFPSEIWSRGVWNSLGCWVGVSTSTSCPPGSVPLLDTGSSLCPTPPPRCCVLGQMCTPAQYLRNLGKYVLSRRCLALADEREERANATAHLASKRIIRDANRRRASILLLELCYYKNATIIAKFKGGN